MTDLLIRQHPGVWPTWDGFGEPIDTDGRPFDPTAGSIHSGWTTLIVFGRWLGFTVDSAPVITAVRPVDARAYGPRLVPHGPYARPGLSRQSWFMSAPGHPGGRRVDVTGLDPPLRRVGLQGHCSPGPGGGSCRTLWPPIGGSTDPNGFSSLTAVLATLLIRSVVPIPGR